jgi:pimeloyl-ACP methyl ester carboxylesterase
MSEPTRPIHQPTVDRDGSLVAHTVATPRSFKIRALMVVPPRRVIPVILVPGIMGTNLRMRRDAGVPDDVGLHAGAPAWRAPNGTFEGILAVRSWSKRDPRQRQLILNADTLEVDDDGEIDVSDALLERADLKSRGWGEVHAESYGPLLSELQRHLNMTFRSDGDGKRRLCEHWQHVIDCDPARWGVRKLAALTESELEKHAAFQYPVYAVGYNWLQSCAQSAERLERRINEIIAFWQSRKHECKEVILVTHSMGGLVARACAKKIPDKIAGVIHGVMPTRGAPVAYRRIARGTESDGAMANDAFATVIGNTSALTTAVMATAPGALELLPTHLYPRPWLHLRTVSTVNKQKVYHDWVNLPAGNSPYPLYRDTKSWYRLVDPALADPAKLYARFGTQMAIYKAIDAAERFHVKILGSYFHPNTYAFYGADLDQRAFGRISWIADDAPGAGRVALTPAAIRNGAFKGLGPGGARQVEIEGCTLSFDIDVQDAAGDGTVPEQSGAFGEGKLKQEFPTRGYEHQNSYEADHILLLTQHLIAKIVQDAR